MPTWAATCFPFRGVLFEQIQSLPSDVLSKFSSSCSGCEARVHWKLPHFAGATCMRHLKPLQQCEGTTNKTPSSSAMVVASVCRPLCSSGQSCCCGRFSYPQTRRALPPQARQAEGKGPGQSLSNNVLALNVKQEKLFTPHLRSHPVKHDTQRKKVPVNPT